MTIWQNPKRNKRKLWVNPKRQNPVEQQETVEPENNIPVPEWLGKLVNNINETGDIYGAPLAAAAIENAMFLPTLVGNVGRNLVGKESVPYADLGQYLKPESNKLGYEIAKFAPAGIGAANILGKGVKHLAQGENLLGQLLRGFSNKATGESVVKGYGRDLAKSKEGFNEVFQEAENAGLKYIPFKINNKDRKVLEKAIGRPALEEALSNPTPQNIHFLRSWLQSWAREVKKLGAHAHPSDKAILGTVDKYVNQTKNVLGRELEKVDPNLLEKYIKSKQFHKEHVRPFQNVGERFIENASLKPGSENYLSPNRIPKKIYSEAGDPFRSSEKMKEFPELAFNRAYKIGALGTTGGTGTLYLLNKLLGGHD